MQTMIECSGLSVARELFELIERDIAPGTGVDPRDFWQGFASIVADLARKNRELLQKRKEFQGQINEWHHQHPGPIDFPAYRRFLSDTGYLVPEGEDFRISTENVDPEIASVAGPQLVVPVSNARYALNAANARWGSLYDAYYGTDLIPEDPGIEKGTSFNPARGEIVILKASELLDRVVPLASGRHRDVSRYVVDDSSQPAVLMADLPDGNSTPLAFPEQFAGFAREDGEERILLQSNGLHLELQVAPAHPIGRMSAAGLKDILLEAAITTIQDCEDSVAAVDAGDKAGVYRNWLGLMKGDLEDTFDKGGRTMTRRLNPDRNYTAPDGSALALPGRSLMLVRNVGHLMTTPAVLDAEGREVPEGFLDGMVTTLCAMHDLRGPGAGGNSRTGSIYIVKPKMHGPEEVAFTNELFSRIEDCLGLDRHTIKVGIMDEERRTTVNLKECILHTSMEAGPVLPKEAIKKQPWILAYEDWNVDIGLECGFRGKAQIGKGMWAMPDEMKAMVETKIAHLEAGANCAWVPSPTAATLHATHYLGYNVSERQEELMARGRASLDDILTPPLLGDTPLGEEAIQTELDNNAQGILGYVVRWVDQGVGCSKVPDINHVGLMEDRATLRISSQHICNWLRHGICSEEQVMETMKRMAKVVDGQNAGDPLYRDMAPDYEDSVAFQAACDLVFQGHRQPSGYTEPLLHQRRAEAKARFGSG
jgi:malate synthase